MTRNWKKKDEDFEDDSDSFDEETMLDIMFPDRDEDDWNDDDDGCGSLMG